MLFAEMSYLTDERCFGEARGIMLLLQALTGMGAGISQPSGELPLFPTWWVLHGCWWYLHMRASPFSRAMGEFRKGVAIALLWLSFLSLGWERGETKLSLSPPCATVPIGFQSSWVIKYWGLLLVQAESNGRTQDWRPKGAVWSVASFYHSELVDPHTIQWWMCSCCCVCSALESQEVLNKRMWNFKNISPLIILGTNFKNCLAFFFLYFFLRKQTDQSSK